jgi:DNA uptake protein ComE-like DNA-binding protein
LISCRRFKNDCLFELFNSKFQMHCFNKKQKLAVVSLCSLALIGAGVRLFLNEYCGSDCRVATATTADSLTVAALTHRLAETAGPVRINSAEVHVLERLPGVGPRLAARIVEERSSNGPFDGPEDLAARVSGIGMATVASWGERMSLVDSVLGGGK